MIEEDKELDLETFTPAANVVTDTDLTLDDVPEWEPPEIMAKGAPVAFDKAGESLDAFQKTIKGLHDTNQSWLKGEISGDVADQLRQQSRLSARMGGVGEDSQMSRNLQARDFGTTSMQLQQQGMQQESAVAQLQQGLAGIREQRSQFMQQMLEQSRQFGGSLEQDSMRTQLAHRELMLKQDANNAQQNAMLIEMISNMVSTQGSLQISAAQSGSVDISGVDSTFESLIGQIGALLKKSNPEK